MLPEEVARARAVAVAEAEAAAAGSDEENDVVEEEEAHEMEEPEAEEPEPEAEEEGKGWDGCSGIGAAVGELAAEAEATSAAAAFCFSCSWIKLGEIALLLLAGCSSGVQMLPLPAPPAPPTVDSESRLPPPVPLADVVDGRMIFMLALSTVVALWTRWARSAASSLSRSDNVKSRDANCSCSDCTSARSKIGSVGIGASTALSTVFVTPPPTTPLVPFVVEPCGGCCLPVPVALCAGVVAVASGGD